MVESLRRPQQPQERSRRPQQQDPNIPTIAFLGMTGAGKTTLMNAFA